MMPAADSVLGVTPPSAWRVRLSRRAGILPMAMFNTLPNWAAPCLKDGRGQSLIYLLRERAL